MIFHTATIKLSKIIIIAIPVQEIKGLIKKIKSLYIKDKIFISASKGIDIETLKPVSEIIHKELSIKKENVFVLSGPSFAKEVALGLPTAITLAGEICKGKEIQKLLNTENFRLYITEDIKGVEIGGAVKNVIAIATGISDGLNLGNNARAALITRGLYEMTKLAYIFGGKIETLYGLAGLGDLVLTATGNLSRNRKLGLLLGKGLNLEKALKEIGQVVEGIKTVKAIRKIKEKYNLELPISETVYKILYENLSPKDAVKLLMSRQPKKEFQ
ncbi:MAG: NAD(P)-dependent glycerol-3-phosphate dehydrogenase [Aquificota bacterium]|nr:MAG: NAD(P)-dependent glycerol-3-phosphate dehydrogenase [Aquificota bacterium]